jgi:hypothetical protein
MFTLVFHEARLGFPAVGAAFVLLAGALSGCGGPSESEPELEGPPSCLPGQVTAGEGACVQVGIQGCADEHVGDDGVCRPLPEHCPAGTIPHFEKGCVPVGIEGCAPQFIGEDGLCRPTMEACPGGTIPNFSTGCSPVGIEDCAPVFLEDDGHCRVRMAKCPDGTFASPQLGCVSIDGPAGCGVGTWGALPDLQGTLYVDASADPAGADGSKAKPFVTLAAALAVVPSGGRIAVAAGQYAEPLHITKPVSIAGRCASMVSISGTKKGGTGLPQIVFFDNVKGASLSGVRLEGNGVGVVMEHAQATIEDVHMQGVSTYGIFTYGSTTEGLVRRTFVENVAPSPPDTPKIETAIIVSGKSSLTVEHSTVYRGFRGGLATLADTTFSGKGLLVEATQGEGLGMEIYGVVSTEDSALVDNRQFGIFAGASANITLTRDVIEGTKASESGKIGHGMELAKGAHVEATSCLVSRSYANGIRSQGKLTLRGSLVENNVVAANGGLGAAADAGVLIIEDSAFDRNKRGALGVEDGAEANVTRTLFAGMGNADGEYFGAPAAVTRHVSTKLVLSDCALIDNQGAGLAAGLGSSMELRRCLVEGTQPNKNGDYGLGVVADHEGTTVLMNRTVLARNQHLAMQLNEGPVVRIEESWVTGTRPSSDPKAGYGAQLLGGTLEVVGSLFSDNRGQMAVAFGQSSLLSLQASVFLGDSSPEDAPRGIAVTDGAHLQMTSSFVRSTGAYAVLAEDASASLSDSTLERALEQAVFGGDTPRVGDGLLALQSTLDLQGVLLSDCPRSGLFLWDVTGIVGTALSTRNRYGVILQGSVPELGPQTVFFDNTETDRLETGDLAVPSAPAPLPTP